MNGAARKLRPDLEPLAKQLAGLPREDRRAVVDAAEAGEEREKASGIATVPEHEGITRTWDAQELAAQLMEMFDVEPLEAGFEHPAERTLLDVLRSAPEIAAETVAHVVEESDAVAPQVIRCAGRLPRSLALKPLLPFVKDALRSPDIVFRDAAVSALEGWGELKPSIFSSRTQNRSPGLTISYAA